RDMRTSSTSRSPLLFLTTVAICIFMVAPVLVSVMAGLVNSYNRGISSGLTLRWVEQVWEVYGSTVGASIGLALACVICTLLLGVPCAYALARSRSRLARAFEELLLLPVAIPGLATALALILVYGNMTSLRQSFVFILIGHVVFTLPFMVRSVYAAFPCPDLLAIEEAARTLGAGFVQRFLGVLVPAVLPAIVAGMLMVFTLSIGEFNLTWMLHTPLTRTLPVGLADSYASMRIEVGSAYTLIFLVVIMPALWALQALATLIQKHYGN